MHLYKWKILWMCLWSKIKRKLCIKDFHGVGLNILPQKSPQTKLKRPSLPSEGKNLHLLRGDKYEV